MRLLSLCKGKIHHAIITEANVDYIGSITIDESLLDASGIIPFERVHIWNLTNGSRLETYAMVGERDSGIICLNGAAAHHASVGDKIIIAAFCWTDEPIEPKLVLVDENNRFVSYLPVDQYGALTEI